MPGFDFNQDQQQSTFTPIPPNSRVLVRLSISYPDQGRASAAHYPLTCSGSSSLEYLAVSLEVLSPSFRGQKIRHNFNLEGASTPNHQTAVRISRSQVRAILEAHAGIMPSDSSPQASQARMIGGWQDLEGREFPIVVGCDTGTSSKTGRRYVTNVLQRIITPDESDFAMLRSCGEFISSEPVPDVNAPAPAAPAPAWAAPSASAPAAAPAPKTSAPQAPPSWAQKPQTTAPAAAPSTAPAWQRPAPGTAPQQTWQPAPPPPGARPMDDMPF